MNFAQPSLSTEREDHAPAEEFVRFTEHRKANLIRVKCKIDYLLNWDSLYDNPLRRRKSDGSYPYK
jgi:hypothetical protein